jgi:hypothetical protein
MGRKNYEGLQKVLIKRTVAYLELNRIKKKIEEFGNN